MYIAQTDSTNNFLQRTMQEHDNLFKDIDSIAYVYTFDQTAGRGQAGNHWEATAGQNLLFSYLLRANNSYEATALPKPERLFDLNMMASLALYRTVVKLLTADNVQHLTIKWPNDLYYQDKKLAGILVENTLQGASIAYSITGIGLNVHQTIWHDGAPNPISLTQITGAQYDMHNLMADFMHELHALIGSSDLREQYLQHLYRREGMHQYMEREVSTAPTTLAQGSGFWAAFCDITPQGELVLRLADNTIKKYHFKQIRYIL